MEYCKRICSDSLPLFRFNGSKPNKVEMISTIANVILNIISSIFAVIGDGSICYVVFTKRRFHTPSNIVIAGLAFTDFVTGLVLQPLYAGFLIAILFQSFSCELAITTYYFSYLCGASTLWTLLVVTLERWMAIIFPFRYSILVSNKKCCFCLTMIWIWTSTTTFLPSLEVVPHKIMQVSTTILYTLLLAAVLVCYTMLYIVIKRKRKMEIVKPVDLSMEKFSTSVKKKENVILAGMINTVVPSEWTSSANNSNKAEYEQYPRPKLRSQTPPPRKENVIAFIIIALVICYIPKSMQESVLVPLTRNHCTAQFVLVSWINTFVYINSSINFILYGYRDRQLLKAAPLFRNKQRS